MSEIVIVAGVTRSGTSLMMQMLEAGGIAPAAGSFPSYELESIGAVTPEIYQSAGGKAIKLVDTQHQMPPRDLPLCVILMRRNLAEQAKSVAKWIRATLNMRISSLDLHLGIERDIRQIETSLRRYPHCRVLSVSFDALIRCPTTQARHIARFVGVPMDVDRMVRQVRPRSAACLPGLLEAQLIEEALTP